MALAHALPAACAPRVARLGSAGSGRAARQQLPSAVGCAARRTFGLRAAASPRALSEADDADFRGANAPLTLLRRCDALADPGALRLAQTTKRPFSACKSFALTVLRRFPSERRHDVHPGAEVARGRLHHGLRARLQARALRACTPLSLKADACPCSEDDIRSQLDAVSPDDGERVCETVAIVFLTLDTVPAGTLKRWGKAEGAVSQRNLALWRGFCRLISDAYFVKGYAWFPIDRLQLEQAATLGRVEAAPVVAERMSVVYQARRMHLQPLTQRTNPDFGRCPPYVSPNRR